MEEERVVTKFIPLADLLDKPAGGEVYVLNKKVNFEQFLVILKERVRYTKKSYDIYWKLCLNANESIIRTIETKDDFIAAIIGLHAPASKILPLFMVENLSPIMIDMS
jgi:hypothetical protein